MDDQLPTEDSPAYQYFLNDWRYWQTGLRGTEQEVAIFKQVAWQWYVAGRRSMIRNCQIEAKEYWQKLVKMEEGRLFE